MAGILAYPGHSCFCLLGFEADDRHRVGLEFVDELGGGIGDGGVVGDDIFGVVDGVHVAEIAGKHLRRRFLGHRFFARQIDLKLLRCGEGVDDLEDDVTGGVDLVGAGEDRAGGDGAVGGFGDELVFDVAFDAVAFELDADVVPAVVFDAGVGGGAEFAVAAVLGFFKGGAGIAPATDVPPDVVVAVEPHGRG